MFDLAANNSGKMRLTCRDKFGRIVEIDKREPLRIQEAIVKPADSNDLKDELLNILKGHDSDGLLKMFQERAAAWDYNLMRWTVATVGKMARTDQDLFFRGGHTLLRDDCQPDFRPRFPFLPPP